MTTIAAISLDGVVAVCADGRELCGSTITEERSRKMWELPGGGLVALAGASRTGNLFELQVLPNLDDRSTAHDIAAAFKKAMDDDGYGRDQDVGSRGYGFDGLAVIGGELWVISSDLHTDPVRDRWPLALGSGYRFAVGAMEAALNTGLPVTAEDFVKLAVAVACRRDSCSGGAMMLALRGAVVDGPRWL